MKTKKLKADRAPKTPARTHPTVKKATWNCPKEHRQLLTAAKRRLPELKALLEANFNHWGYEDPIYRFYHQSFKVYRLQNATLKIVAALRALAPKLELNPFFLKIVADGTGKEFQSAHNANWLKHTRPILEAFFHAHHMLLMVCVYAEKLTEPPQVLPSGWATVLYLYNVR